MISLHILYALLPQCRCGSIGFSLTNSATLLSATFVSMVLSFIIHAVGAGIRHGLLHDDFLFQGSSMVYLKAPSIPASSHFLVLRLSS